MDSAIYSEVDVTIINDTVYLRGLPAKTFLKDLTRIYRYDSVVGEDFFKLIITGFLIQRATMSFNRYFSLEVYSMFARLYQTTERIMYKEAADNLVDTDDRLRKYLTPPIPVPEEILNKLNDIKLELFPYQKEFLDILYNSKYKLGLRGNINSFGTGMGKTISVLACIYAMNEYPCIITAPKSTLHSSWEKSILDFIPNIKPEEVQVITDYNPKYRWKYLITNYEQLPQVYKCLKTANGDKVKSLVIDESHNFRYITTARSQRLIDLVTSLDLQTVIPISGTPIKARTSELIPILKILDPNMTDAVIKIFKKMYGKDNYSPLVESVIRKRLSIYIDKEELDEKTSVGFPKKEKYNVSCTIKNPEKYYVSTVKKEMREFVNKEIPVYAKMQKPSFEKVKELVSRLPDDQISNDVKYDYIFKVKTKMSSPMSEAGRSAMIEIQKYEMEFKKVNSELGKEIVATRKLCTSWLQSLIGKAMGIYFVMRRVDCITDMVRENIGVIADIIKEAELKSLVFSNYIKPLETSITCLNKKNLNGMMITGGVNTTDLLQKFYNDNTMDFVAGSIGAIGTGTDGMQKYISTCIFTDLPYRNTDLIQAEARIYRRGAVAKTVKFYYLKLDSPEKNLVDNANEILEWSKNMFDLAMDLEGQNLQGSLEECISKVDATFELINE